MHVDYSVSKKRAFSYIILLGAVTIFEVFFALFGKGYIGGVHLPTFIIVLVMIGLSAFKAYCIVKEYMHMGYEVRSFAMSVVLPTLLLVWAIIAFLWEGGTWGHRREGTVRPAERAAVQVAAPVQETTAPVANDTLKSDQPDAPKEDKPAKGGH
jgi:cytochrome c oxidase subunit 4